jgi:hypothetical protein
MLISEASRDSSRISFAKRFAELLDIRFMVSPLLPLLPARDTFDQERQEKGGDLQYSRGN